MRGSMAGKEFNWTCNCEAWGRAAIVKDGGGGMVVLRTAMELHLWRWGLGLEN